MKSLKLVLFSLSALIISGLMNTSCKCQKTNKGNLKEVSVITSVLKTDKSFKPDGMPVDYTIDTAYVKVNNLIIMTSYAGGCGQHSFELVWSGVYYKSLPMKAPLQLIHKVTKENCKDIMKNTLLYDISELKQPNNKLILLLSGYKKSNLFLGQ